MKNYFRAANVCALFLILMMPFAMACGSRAASDSSQAAAAPPDLNGVWSAPFTPDISKALGHQPPFTAYGAARFAKEDEIDDPLTKCLPIGPARGIQAGLMPFQIVQTPSVFTILFENQHTFRIIHTDGRSHPKDLDPTWFGDSVGKWDGDTLVVDTVGLDDRTWLDTAGRPHSEDLRVEEVFHQVAQRPGMPLWFGIGPGGQAVFGLPGNPVATLVCLIRYVVPAMSAAMGARSRAPELIALAAPVKLNKTMAYFLPVSVQYNDLGQAVAAPRPPNGPGDFLALTAADGFVELPPRAEPYPEGFVASLYRW